MLSVGERTVRKYRALLLAHPEHRDDPALLLREHLPERGANTRTRPPANKKRSPHADAVLAQALAEHAEYSLQELADLLEQRVDVCVSTSSVCRWLHSGDFDYTHKQLSVRALPRESERVKMARARFIDEVQPRLPHALDHLLSCDQSHVDERSAQRKRGYAKRGERAVAYQPYNGGAARRQRLTLIGAVGVTRNKLTGRLEPVRPLTVHSGSTTRATMITFVRDKLNPSAERMRANQPPPPAAALRSPPLSDGSGRRRRRALLAPHSARPQRRRRPPAHWRLDDDFDYDCHGSDSDRSDESSDADGDNDDDDSDGNYSASSSSEDVSASDSDNDNDDDDEAPHRVYDPASAVHVTVDNWSAHKGDEMLRAFGTHSSRLFVPPYSPDLNFPIEGAWGDVKQWLRKNHYWGRPALTVEVLQRAWLAVTNVSSILARFKHAGYAVSDELLAEACAQDNRAPPKMPKKKRQGECR